MNKTEPLNKSYSYLIPLLNEECKIDINWFLLINNVYTNYEYEKDVICIKYDKYTNDDYIKYLEELKSNKLFKYCISSDEYEVLIFDFPNQYLQEYVCFKRGRFSEFRDIAKRKILDYILSGHSIKQVHNIRDVLYKSNSLRKTLEDKLNIQLDKDTELSSIPDIEKETLIL